MSETTEPKPAPRRRPPKRTALYLTLLAVSAALSLGAAWRAAHPVPSGPAALVR